MTNQRGQSAVEFAFIVPFVMFIVLGGIYGGILFMDYIQYNNAARAIARAVTVENIQEVNEINSNDMEKKYFNPLTNLYKAELQPIKIENQQVTVTINLSRQINLGLFDFLEFPPENLKPIVYSMPMERG